MRRHADAMIAELAVPAPDSEPLHFPTEYAVGRLGQLKIIVWKLSCVYWRYTGMLVTVCATLSIVLGAEAGLTITP